MTPPTYDFFYIRKSMTMTASQLTGGRLLANKMKKGTNINLFQFSLIICMIKPYVALSLACCRQSLSNFV